MIMRIALIEDDLHLASFIKKGLGEAGFMIRHASTGIDGLDLVLNENFDLGVIDLMLPGMDGLTIIEKMREREIGFPVIILSARRSVDDRIRGLQQGGDDYVTKPFNRRELLARIKNLLRRTEEARRVSRKLYRFEGYEFDPQSRRLQGPTGAAISVTRAEYEVLNLLISRAGEVIDRDVLMGIVTHRHYGTNPRTVDVLIRRLRAKLEVDPSAPQLITTAHGEGYVFTGRLT